MTLLTCTVDAEVYSLVQPEYEPLPFVCTLQPLGDLWQFPQPPCTTHAPHTIGIWGEEGILKKEFDKKLAYNACYSIVI